MNKFWIIFKILFDILVIIVCLNIFVELNNGEILRTNSNSLFWEAIILIIFPIIDLFYMLLYFLINKIRK